MSLMKTERPLIPESAISLSDPPSKRERERVTVSPFHLAIPPNFSSSFLMMRSKEEDKRRDLQGRSGV